MRAITFIIYLGILFTSIAKAQYITEIPHETSRYYKEMFPPNIDRVKLLVVLPKALSKPEVDTLLKGQAHKDVDKSYEFHLKTTEEIKTNVVDHVKKYAINCEVIQKDDYNLETYPVDKFPLVVYPDSMLVDQYYVTFGYHIHDMVNKTNYGYLMGSDPDFDNKYFKQLATYIKKLKRKKAKMENIEDIDLRAETKIYNFQKNSKIFTNYIALPLAFVTAVGGFLFLLNQ